MKIAVINGSPKGQYSITIQTILYLQKKNPKLEIEILHASQMIKSLENDFTRAKELLDSSDAVIFSYPVYTFIAPSQLHRFIELMKEHNIDMTDKYVTQLTTSKHVMTLRHTNISRKICSIWCSLHKGTFCRYGRSSYR